jgi:hypothetical protein
MILSLSLYGKGMFKVNIEKNCAEEEDSID